MPIDCAHPCVANSLVSARHTHRHAMHSRSSQSGPSRVPHWNPCTMLSFTELSKPLSTWDEEKNNTPCYVSSPINQSSGPLYKLPFKLCFHTHTHTHLRRQRVVHEDVGSRRVGAERPDGPGGQQIPVVLVLKELSEALARPRDLHNLVLDVLRQTLLERLRDHRDFVSVEQQHDALKNRGPFPFNCSDKSLAGVATAIRRGGVVLRVHKPPLGI